MTQETPGTLPKFLKDADGYCYPANPLLAAQAHLTPWDGEVNAAGFAVERAPVKPVAPAAVTPAPKAASKSKG